MKHRIRLFAFAASVVLSLSMTAQADSIGGPPDRASGGNWQSAWVGLDPPRDFRKGEVLKIQVQGTAEWVRVRLLPVDGNPEKPTGLIGGKIKVPAGGVIEIELEKDRPRVEQVSVHAGKLAWGELLNPDGGSIEIVSVDVLAP